MIILDEFELADEVADNALIAVLNTGKGAREVLGLFQKSDICADLIIDDEDIMSGDASRIEAAIGRWDMVIILSDLSDQHERELACKIAGISKKSDVLTLVFNLVPFEFKDSGKVAGAKLLKSSILKTDLYLAVTEDEAFETLVTKAKNIKDAIDAVTKLVIVPGMICVDFSDLRAVICNGKQAVFGSWVSTDISYAVDKVMAGSDFININKSNITGVFVTLTGGLSLTLEDFILLGELIELNISKDCTIAMGTVVEPSFNDLRQVSVVFNGPALY